MERMNDDLISTFDVRTPTGTDDPLSSSDRGYREEINRLDNLIIDAIRRRTE